MTERFNGGKRGYFTCDRAGCKAGRIVDWQLAAVVTTKDGRRRDYCSVACLELAEAGRFEVVPHHPACIKVTFGVVHPRRWGVPFEQKEEVRCVSECPRATGPTRYRRVEKARPNSSMDRSISERTCSSGG